MSSAYSNGVSNGLGDTWSDLLSILQGLTPDRIYLVSEIVNDPAFPELVTVVNRISRAEQASAGLPVYDPNAIPFTPPSIFPTPSGVGVGLSKFIPILNAYAWRAENPFLGNVAVLAILATPVLIGIVIGKAIKKCTKEDVASR